MSQILLQNLSFTYEGDSEPVFQGLDLQLDPTVFFTNLRKLAFDRSLFDRDMSGYSLGQKKKVLLAASLCRSAHLYVWDEPLNYIDLFSRMQLEALILEYRPTLLFVEHDRQFRDRIATGSIGLTLPPGQKK